MLSPQVICAPRTRVFTYSVCDSPESPFSSSISSDCFSVNHLPGPLYPSWDEEEIHSFRCVVTASDRAFCFVLHSFFPVRSATQSAFLTAKLVYRQQQRGYPTQQCHGYELLLLCTLKLIPNSLVSAPLWKGKFYSWINSSWISFPLHIFARFTNKSNLRGSSCSTIIPLHSRTATSINIHKQTSLF